MTNPTPRSLSAEQLAERHLPLARQISYRLKRRYHWLDADELLSYAYTGLVLCARLYDPQRGLSFPRFAAVKAMYLAIDELRKDGLLNRSDSTPTVTTEPIDGEWDLPDPASRQSQKSLEARELCSALLQKLDQPQRELLMMIYGDQMTYREIARVHRISESAVCLRHKTVIERLRRMATVRRLAA